MDTENYENNIEITKEFLTLLDEYLKNNKPSTKLL